MLATPEPTTPGVSVVGLGKLGASLAAVLAASGARVVGVDVDPRAVERVSRGLAPVDETGLADLIAAHAGSLTATLDAAAAVASTEATFVIVPTPSDTDGRFSLAPMQAALREVGRGLRDKDGWHLVVVTSTVLPGDTRGGLVPVLEEASGKRCGPDFGVCYSPAFIALGSVIRGLTHPDLVLVGESDQRAGAAAEALWRRILANGAPVRRMSLENAELAKVALNSYVTLKISFANMLAELCERLPGGDVDVVTGALGLDRRVGERYLRGGTAFGGPCFPRDNRALASAARALGVHVPLAAETDRVNHATLERLVRAVGDHMASGKVALVLGLAYKPDTWVTEESAGLALAVALARDGGRVLAWDPMVTTLPPELAEEVELVASLEEGVARADVVVVTLPDPAFLALEPRHFAGRGEPAVVLDCWRHLRHRLEGAEGVRYVAWGVGPEPSSSASNGQRS